MTDDHRQRVDLLILARLATAGTRSLSAAKVEQELFRFVQARFSRGEWSTRCADGLEALRTRDEVDDRRIPTSKGRERLNRALGVRTLPTRWSKVWRALVPALTLELPGGQWSEVDSAEKLRARVIRQHHDLSLPPSPTLAQAVDAQAWQALGIDETGPLTLGKLRRALLERTLQSSLRANSIDTAGAGKWLATIAVGATTREVATIQRALVSRWLFEGGGSKPSEAESDPPIPQNSRQIEAKRVLPARNEPKRVLPARSEPKPGRSGRSNEPLSLERWAAMVHSLAQRTSSGLYGEERVFIAAVWRAAQKGPRSLRGSLPDFKARLVEANRAGLLCLHRADLVGAMDEQLVRESETRHLNATFHFIEIPSRRTS